MAKSSNFYPDFAPSAFCCCYIIYEFQGTSDRESGTVHFRTFEGEYLFPFSIYINRIVKQYGLTEREYEEGVNFLQTNQNWINSYFENKMPEIHINSNASINQTKWGPLYNSWRNNLYNTNLPPYHLKLMEIIGPHWYPAAYRCEECQGELLKIVFPVGNEFNVFTSQNEEWKIKCVFTCPNCFIVYAPKPRYRYSQILLSFS